MNSEARTKTFAEYIQNICAYYISTLLALKWLQELEPVVNQGTPGSYFFQVNIFF